MAYYPSTPHTGNYDSRRAYYADPAGINAEQGFNPPPLEQPMYSAAPPAYNNIRNYYVPDYAPARPIGTIDTGIENENVGNTDLAHMPAYRSAYGQLPAMKLPNHGTQDAAVNGALGIISTLGPYGAIAGAVGKVGYGAYQALRSRNELRKLGKLPLSNITPEAANAYAMAQQNAQRGFTPEQVAQFNANMGRQNTMALTNGAQYGNSRATLSGINAANAGALVNFAAQDAQLRNQNIRYADQMGANITAQRNRMVQERAAQYNQAQQALGKASQDGVFNVLSGVQNAGDMGLAANGIGSDGSEITSALKLGAATGGVPATKNRYSYLYFNSGK
jgi:hypothetical protein